MLASWRAGVLELEAAKGLLKIITLMGKRLARRFPIRVIKLGVTSVEEKNNHLNHGGL